MNKGGLLVLNLTLGFLPTKATTQVQAGDRIPIVDTQTASSFQEILLFPLWDKVLRRTQHLQLILVCANGSGL
jgi:hypothetical protein